MVRPRETRSWGALPPQTPRSLALLRPTVVPRETDRVSAKKTWSSGVQPTVRRSGRTPAEPYPPNGKAKTTRKKPYRPAKHHPWATFLLRRKRGHFYCVLTEKDF